jgi:hypothetical protein
VRKTTGVYQQQQSTALSNPCIAKSQKHRRKALIADHNRLGTLSHPRVLPSQVVCHSAIIFFAHFNLH